MKVLDMMDQIAAAKVRAWWGWDYILLAKQDDKWIIEQVLWQGPPK